MTSSYLSLAPEYVEAELEDSCATLLALELLRPAVATDHDRREQLIRHIASVRQSIADVRDRHGGAANPLGAGWVLAADGSRPPGGSGPPGGTQPPPSPIGSGLG
jgi:hypothetical protein